MLIVVFMYGCTSISDEEVEAKFGDAAPDADTGIDSGQHTDTGVVDADGDRFTVADGDCDDTDPAVNPDASEDCSTSADDNCDGDTNDVNAIGCSAFYEDGDGDGYGGAAGECLCVATADVPAANGDDCDDGDAAVNPAAVEICNDGLDDNCDGGPGACVPTSENLSAAVEYTGPPSEQAGRAVAGAGDVNADGYDDILTGAYGKAYLTLGVATPASAPLDLGLSYSGIDNDGAGLALAGAGDVNSDGFDDFLVGAYNGAAGSPAGAAYLVLGSGIPRSASLATGIEYTGSSYYASGEAAGCSVSGAGDVNGDGYDDMVVGAHNYVDGTAQSTGAAYLILGSPAPASESLATSDRYQGEAAGDHAGGAVSGGGDVDGDGYDDIAIGAYGAESTGAAYLVLGGPSPSSSSLSTAVQLGGEAEADGAGRSVAVAGDVDGDGYDDVVVGAYAAGDSIGTNAGAAYLVLGGSAPASGSLSSAVKFTGEAANNFAGFSVARGGDVDHDGFADILVGAYNNSNSGSGAGAAYLVMGSAVPAPLSLSDAVEYSGEAADDNAGWAVAGAGDVNQDGVLDMLVGAPVGAAAGTDSGASYLILGIGL